MISKNGATLGAALVLRPLPLLGRLRSSPGARGARGPAGGSAALASLGFQARGRAPGRSTCLGAGRRGDRPRPSNYSRGSCAGCGDTRGRGAGGDGERDGRGFRGPTAPGSPTRGATCAERARGEGAARVRAGLCGPGKVLESVSPGAGTRGGEYGRLLPFPSPLIQSELGSALAVFELKKKKKKKAILSNNKK